MYKYKMYDASKIDFIEKVVCNSFTEKFWEPAINMIRENTDNSVSFMIVLFTLEEVPVGLTVILTEYYRESDEEKVYIDRFEIADSWKNKGHGSRIIDTLRSIYNGTDLEGYAIAPSARFWAKNSSDYNHDTFKRYEEQHEGSDEYLFEMDTKLMWFIL